MMQYFEMDGNLFGVDVITFERQFAHTLTENAGTTLDGAFHWDARGQLTYLATFRTKPGQSRQMEELWQALMENRIHSCVFPDGYMDAYVVSCRQSLDSTHGGYAWGLLEVRFQPVQMGVETDATADP